MKQMYMVEFEVNGENKCSNVKAENAENAKDIVERFFAMQTKKCTVTAIYELYGEGKWKFIEAN